MHHPAVRSFFNKKFITTAAKVDRIENRWFDISILGSAKLLLIFDRILKNVISRG